MNALRHWPSVARVLLGTIFFVLGLNGPLQFLPPFPVTPEGAAFLDALLASGYTLVLLALVEVTAGALLLANRFVPLALTVLAPIVVNIVGFHSVLDPGGLWLASLVLVLELSLAWSYRETFAPLLRARVSAAEPVALPRLSTPASAPT